VKGNAGQTNYAASKAGVIGLQNPLELGSRNIRCNAITRVYRETEMTAKLNDDVVSRLERWNSFEKRWYYRRCC
jgi:3-oxoacyl-[acyl-carrier protein] reductase